MISAARILGALALLAATSLLAAPRHAGAARGADERRIAERLAPALADSVRHIIARMKAKQLPVRPLIDTALEGAARGVPNERILAAVHSQAKLLASAAQALGPKRAEAELVAGASALRAGIAADSLAHLRPYRPESAVIPLVVMADLAARGAPPALAVSAVLEAVRGGAHDTELMRLREHVASDIQAGATPAEAALLRTRALLLDIEPRMRSGVREPRPPFPRGRP